MDTQWLLLRQLDRQLKAWRRIAIEQNRPKLGWVSTIRTALGMSMTQLGNRMGGLKRARIAQLEAAEIHDAITLHTLRNAAEALDCELVYAIVPKKASTLEGIIKERAQYVAADTVARVAHSMSLEAQSVQSRELKKQQDELAKSLYEYFNKNLWDNTIEKDLSQEDKFRERLVNSLVARYEKQENEKNKKSIFSKDEKDKLIKGLIAVNSKKE